MLYEAENKNKAGEDKTEKQAPNGDRYTGIAAPEQTPQESLSTGDGT